MTEPFRRGLFPAQSDPPTQAPPLRPEKNGTIQYFWDSGYAAGVASQQDEVAGWREHAEHLEDAQNAANKALTQYEAVAAAALAVSSVIGRLEWFDDDIQPIFDKLRTALAALEEL